MHRNQPNGKWVVRQLIEQDHVNHHYRRLNGAQSQLHLNNNRNSTISRNRLFKSINDVRVEGSLRDIEKQMAGEFCLNIFTSTSEKKNEISDETLDVMVRHSQYFTQPKNFTPRVVRKIVRPNTSTTIRPVSSTCDLSKTDSTKKVAAKLANVAGKTEMIVAPADPERNLSADSAFGDEPFMDSTSSTSDSSQETDVFNIKKWLREQEEENCYMQLMCDITADLLQRKLSTNGNMKEVIAMYIRKSRKKFSVGKEILMKRLCEDLMIPSDKRFDEQFYGSRCKAVPTCSPPIWRDDKQEIGMFYKITNSRNQYPKRDINQTETKSKKIQGYNSLLANSSSALKTQNLESLQTDPFEDKSCIPLKNDDHTEKTPENSLLHTLHLAANGRQVKDIPDIDGYFSDFTDDTDDDIEEEFDFD